MMFRHRCLQGHLSPHDKLAFVKFWVQIASIGCDSGGGWSNTGVDDGGGRRDENPADIACWRGLYQYGHTLRHRRRLIFCKNKQVSLLIGISRVDPKCLVLFYSKVSLYKVAGSGNPREHWGERDGIHPCIDWWNLLVNWEGKLLWLYMLSFLEMHRSWGLKWCWCHSTAMEIVDLFLWCCSKWQNKFTKLGRIWPIRNKFET